MHRKLSNYCRGMGDLVSQVLDLTYPAVSMLRGRSFNRSADTDLSQPLTADSVIHDAFRDKAIEDLWLPYFCISTDVSELNMRVHRHVSGMHFPATAEGACRARCGGTCAPACRCRGICRRSATRTTDTSCSTAVQSRTEFAFN